MKKILVIQTAFLGDAILATSLIEKLKSQFNEASIFYLVRKGNESLFYGHPHIQETLVWDKSENKYASLIGLLKKIRRLKFDLVVNVQRYASSGILTVFSGAKTKVGFRDNPFSFLFDFKMMHQIGDGKHEIERNHTLISELTDEVPALPKLYPSVSDYELVSTYKNEKYYCIAPSSVWFTKQWPEEKWTELTNLLYPYRVYVLGAKTEAALSDRIAAASTNDNVVNLAGKLSLLQSAALLKDAEMNFVNDSGPLHLSSAMNAPVTSVFCSTIKDFGFFPLSEKSYVVETKEKLSCRPCGLHGYKKCPEGHFKCGRSISAQEVFRISYSS